jgi:hypothetical protein
VDDFAAPPLCGGASAGSRALESAEVVVLELEYDDF